MQNFKKNIIFLIISILFTIFKLDNAIAANYNMVADANTCSGSGCYSGTTAGVCDSWTSSSTTIGSTAIYAFRISMYDGNKKIGTTVNYVSTKKSKEWLDNSEYFSLGTGDRIQYIQGQVPSKTLSKINTIVWQQIPKWNENQSKDPKIYENFFMDPTNKYANIKKIIKDTGNENLIKWSDSKKKFVYKTDDLECDETKKTNIYIVIEPATVVVYGCVYKDENGVQKIVGYSYYFGTAYEMNYYFNTAVNTTLSSSSSFGYSMSSIPNRALLNAIYVNKTYDDLGITSSWVCLPKYSYTYWDEKSKKNIDVYQRQYHDHEVSKGYGVGVINITDKIHRDCGEPGGGKPDCCVPTPENEFCCEEEKYPEIWDEEKAICITYKDYWKKYPGNWPENSVVCPKPNTDDNCPGVGEPTFGLAICTPDNSQKVATFRDPVTQSFPSEIANTIYNSDNGYNTFKALANKEVSENGYSLDTYKSFGTFCSTYCQETLTITLPDNHPYVNAGRYFYWDIKDSGSNHEIIQVTGKKICAHSTDLGSWIDSYNEIARACRGGGDTLAICYDVGDTAVGGGTDCVKKAEEKFEEAVGNLTVDNMAAALYEECKKFCDTNDEQCSKNCETEAKQNAESELNKCKAGNNPSPEKIAAAEDEAARDALAKIMEVNLLRRGCSFSLHDVETVFDAYWDSGATSESVANAIGIMSDSCYEGDVISAEYADYFNTNNTLNQALLKYKGFTGCHGLLSGELEAITTMIEARQNYAKCPSLGGLINALNACAPEIMDDEVEEPFPSYTGLSIEYGYRTFDIEKTYTSAAGEIISQSRVDNKPTFSPVLCVKKDISDICNKNNSFVLYTRDGKDYCNYKFDAPFSGISGKNLYYGASMASSATRNTKEWIISETDVSSWWQTVYVETVNIDDYYKLNDTINACVCKDGTVINLSSDGECECAKVVDYNVIADESTVNYCYFEWESTTSYSKLENGNFSVDFMSPSGWYPLYLSYGNIGENSHFSDLMDNDYPGVPENCDGGVCVYSNWDATDGVCSFFLNNKIMNDNGKVDDSICPNGDCENTDECPEGDCIANCPPDANCTPNPNPDTDNCPDGDCDRPILVSGLDLIYRVIDLDDPFHYSETGQVRPAGANWSTKGDINPVDKYITNNRGVEGNKLYSDPEIKPLYTFELNPAIIKKIKEFNKKNRDYSSVGTMIYGNGNVTGGVSYVLRGELKSIIESNGGIFEINLPDDDERFSEIINSGVVVDSNGNLATCSAIGYGEMFK